MNEMSVHGGFMSMGVGLAGSTLGLGFLSRSNAKSISNLNHAKTPIIDVAPTIKELSDSELKIDDIVDSTSVKTDFTQKQLECAEKLGVDPLECSKNGELVKQKKHSDGNHRVKKRQTNTEITELQRECAQDLNVDPSECNTNGVFINRTPQISEEILRVLIINSGTGVSSWEEMTKNDLKLISRLSIEDRGTLNITSLETNDLHGLTELEDLRFEHANITTIPEGLFRTNTKLEYVRMFQNQIESIPENLFYGLSILEDIEMHSNKIKSIPENILRNLYKLRLLNLFNNQLTAFNINNLDQLTELERIYIDNNKVTLTESFFSELQNTSSKLNLAYSKVSVSIGSFTIALEDIAHFFSTEIDSGIKLMKPSVPEIPETVSELTELQQLFLYTFLRTELEKVEDQYVWVSELLNTLRREECAHILNVSLSECNRFGVYTNRSKQISESILNATQFDSWANVTQGALNNITTLNIPNNILSELKKHDFSGLNNLKGLQKLLNGFIEKLENNRNTITSLEENREFCEEDLKECGDELDSALATKNNAGDVTSSNSVLVFMLFLGLLLKGSVN